MNITEAVKKYRGNVRVLAKVTTGEPIILYMPASNYLLMKRFTTNVPGYMNGQIYWCNVWNCFRADNLLKAIG